MNDNYHNILTISVMFFSGSFLLFIPVAWLLFGYPIGRLMICSNRFLSHSNHPVVIHFIHRTSGVIFGASFLNFIILMSFYYDHGAISDVRFAVCMYILLLCYGIYFNTNIEKIVAKYDKEFNKERTENNNNKEYYQNHEMEKWN